MTRSRSSYWNPLVTCGMVEFFGFIQRNILPEESTFLKLHMQYSKKCVLLIYKSKKNLKKDYLKYAIQFNSSSIFLFNMNVSLDDTM